MIAIIGAGISGITAALALQRECLVFEKTARIGGLSGQYESGEYRFDYGGHYFHFQNLGHIRSRLEQVALLRAYRKRSRVFLEGRFLPYPVQYHLARFPASRRRRMLAEMLDRPDGTGAHLREYLYQAFGQTLFGLFFEPYLQKFWQTPLTRLAPDMDHGTIPVPDRRSLLQGAQGKSFAGVGYNRVFYYPPKGMQAFLDAYSRPLGSRLRLAEPVTAVDLKNQTVKTPRGTYRYRFLINTAPLKEFIGLLQQRNEFDAAGRLSHLSTLVVNAVLKQRRRHFHWVYLPEKQFPFYRAGFYPGRRPAVCYLEKTVPPDSVEAQDSVRQQAVMTLRRLGMIASAREITHLHHLVIPVSYIRFDLAWKSVVPPLVAELRRRGVFSIGRYGSWTYTSMSEDIAQALDVAGSMNEK